MKTGTCVKIKTGVWSAAIGVISNIDKTKSFPYLVIEQNGREHNECATNLLEVKS